MRWIWWYLKPRLRRWRPYLPVVLVVVGATVAGIALDLALSNVAPLHWRAERAARLGDYQAAERLYWQLLARGQADVPQVLQFLDIHAALVATAEMAEDLLGLETGIRPPQPSVTEDQIEAFLGGPDLPAAVSLVCSFWRAVLRQEVTDETRARLVDAADQEPPMPWANHVLALAELHAGDRRIEAVRRFEREGLRRDGPEEDLALALNLLQAMGKNAEVQRRLADPRFRSVVEPSLRVEQAAVRGAWGEWLLWLWPASYLRGDPVSWLLAALAAGLWLWFCWRLAGIGVKVRTQITAFLLGALSIYPTDLLIRLERYLVPGLQPRGDIVGDAIFYTVGVGLREEGAKLLCFLPLLLVLRRARRGSGLVLGALVGLGFAAVENVSYLTGGDLSTGLARFLTANFLHMSLTAIVGEAAAAVVRHDHDAGAELVRTFALAVLLHGVYDTFLTCPQLAEYSFLAMTTFVITAQRFLRSAPAGQARGGIPLHKVVALALVILAAALFIYGSAVAGAGPAAIALGEGMLGVVLITAVFHRELATGSQQVL